MKSALNMKPETMTSSPGSYTSMENAKGGMEEESENSTNVHLKKPVFTITRQNKLSPNVCTEQIENKASPNVNYNRKEKSLGELSKRFLTMFGRIDDCIISLDTVTKQLDVERRRVYDIINILESLGVVYRKGKNNYQWSGLKPIRKTIEKLQFKAALGVKQEADDNNNDDSSADENLVDQRLANKKEKSLAYLAGSFIKLFFTWKETIPLEEAAWKLSPNDIDEHKIKTKIRRLYDIANVFSSLGLIKKICLDSKKPAFKWIGNQGLDEFIRKLNSSAGKQSASTEKTPKKKMVKSVSVSSAETAEKSPQSNIASKNSAFKNHNDQPVKQNVMNNFVNVLLDLCKKEIQPKKAVDQFEQLSLGPVAGQQNLEQMLNIKPVQKSVEENQTTSDRILKENINTMNVKRHSPQSLGEFEIRTVKKINPIAQANHEKTIVKSLKFNAKETYSFETKVEN